MALAFSELTVGQQRVERVCDNLTRSQIVQYAGASGDFHPLHTDEYYAINAAGLPGVFAPGMLTMGLTAKMVTNWVGDGRLRRFAVRFVAQVWPGDTLDAHAVVIALREHAGRHFVDLDLTTVNQAGRTVITGHATAEIDARNDGMATHEEFDLA